MTTLPRINGTDELSKAALALLGQGKPLVELEAIGLSKDQAKKLGRLRWLLSDTSEHLPAGAMEKLQALGLKAVALAGVIQAADWTGLIEILQTIEPATVKREDLERAPMLLAEKRTRVAEIEQQMKAHLEYLLRKQGQLQQEQARLEELEKQVDQAISFLTPYPEHIREFLAEHLGVDAIGRLALARRLDQPWQSTLKQKGVLRYDRAGTVWLVGDLDALAKATERRLKNGNPVRYDPERVKSLWDTPSSDRYRFATGLAVDLQEARKKQKERLAQIRKEMVKATKEIKEIRHRSPQSFLEAVQAANTLSEKDLETHGRLQAAVLRWQYDQGCTTTA